MALSHLVVQYESNFCTVALQFMEEEKNYPLPSPATTGRTTAGTVLRWRLCNSLAQGPQSELSAGPSFCGVLSPRVKSWPHRYLQFLSSHKTRKGKKEGLLDPLVSFLVTFFGNQVTETSKGRRCCRRDWRSHFLLVTGRTTVLR